MRNLSEIFPNVAAPNMSAIQHRDTAELWLSLAQAQSPAIVSSER
jgi:hypothetical protein